MNTELEEQEATAPIKVVQFGGGVFMRGFISWMLQEMKQAGHYQGAAAVIKLTSGGDLNVYEQQQGVFHHIIRGMEKGAVVSRMQRISSIKQWIHPYEAWDDFLHLAESPELEAVFSNSTEAGIAYASCAFPKICPESFPAKLCAFLHRRFTRSLAGLWIFPCELIESNADTLLEIVCHHADDWKLGEGFIDWLRNQNTWVNTLADRIVSPPQADESAAFAAQAGIEDGLLNSSEPYHIFVLDCDDRCEAILPFQKSGLNIVYSDNLAAYRERKVKLLNGAHTAMLYLAYRRGHDTVEEALADPVIASFLQKCLSTEVIPTIDMDRTELEVYAKSVTDRFKNPFLKHQLLSISLNSVSKIRYRILQTIQDYHGRFDHLPPHLMLALAAFLRFYRVQKNEQGDFVGRREEEAYTLADNKGHLSRIVKMWADRDAGMDPEELLSELFAREDIWGADFSIIPEFVVQLALLLGGVESLQLDELAANAARSF